MFSASLTFLLITWRRHLLSKNPQSSVRGDEVGKCTVRSACFLVPYAGSIQPKLPEISVQNSIQPGKFSQKKKKLVHLLRWTTFLGRTGRKFWLNWSRPWCPHMKLKWSAFKTRPERHGFFDISWAVYLSETDYWWFRPKGLSTYFLFSPLNVNW